MRHSCLHNSTKPGWTGDVENAEKPLKHTNKRNKDSRNQQNNPSGKLYKSTKEESFLSNAILRIGKSLADRNKPIRGVGESTFIYIYQI